MEKNKNLLKVIIILLLIIIILLTVFFMLRNQTEQNNLTANTNMQNETQNKEIQNENKTVTRLGQSFKTETGTYIITKEGDVYLIPANSALDDNKIELPENIGTYGYYNTKDVYICDPMPENEEDLGSFNGYKLNLINIQSGYSFTNKDENMLEYIIFVDTNGNISELKYETTPTNTLDVNLTKNIQNCQNIVTIINTYNENGTCPKLIDAEGNQYLYHNSSNIENVSNLGFTFMGEILFKASTENIFVTVDSNGNAYCYSTSSNIDLSTCGVKGDYSNIDLPYVENKNLSDVYKLNISNVTAVYGFNFGNGGTNYSLLLLDKDGNITEISIIDDVNGITTTMSKNTEYTNVVTIVNKLYTGSHGAIVIDKDGNEYYYNNNQ